VGEICSDSEIFCEIGGNASFALGAWMPLTV